MEVTFDIVAADGELLDEQTIAAEFEKLKAWLIAEDALEGILAIINGESNRVTPFRDALEPLMGGLCFDTIPKLAQGETVEHWLFAYNERYELKVEGNEVVLTGDLIREARYPRQPLLSALVHCGERFVGLLKQLHGEDPAWTDRLAAWEQAATEARANLRLLPSQAP